MNTLPVTNIHWLLNQIDETAPQGCKTCLYAGTHECCDGCLVDTENDGLWYSNWCPGNSVMHLYEHQRAGKSVIVIGGQGEAEFYATDSPKKVAAHLRMVSNECGYLAGHIKGTPKEVQTLTITINEGTFLILWDSGRLSYIREKTVEGGYKPSWPDADTIEALRIL